jgi:hypothetical protein
VISILPGLFVNAGRSGADHFRYRPGPGKPRNPHVHSDLTANVSAWNSGTRSTSGPSCRVRSASACNVVGVRGSFGHVLLGVVGRFVGGIAGSEDHLNRSSAGRETLHTSAEGRKWESEFQDKGVWLKPDVTRSSDHDAAREERLARRQSRPSDRLMNDRRNPRRSLDGHPRAT